MANINVPEQAIPAFNTLASLEQDVFGLMLSAFSNASPTLTPRQFHKSICKTIKGVQPKDIWDVPMAVLPLFDIKDEENISVKELAEEIGLSLNEAKPKGFPIEKTDLIVARLKQLLNLNKTLAVVAKASDIMTDHEHLFCNAKILSDIRPIFTDTPESASSAVMIHNLQIGFHDSATNKHREIYFALDTDEIQELKRFLNARKRRHWHWRQLWQSPT